MPPWFAHIVPSCRCARVVWSMCSCARMKCQPDILTTNRISQGMNSGKPVRNICAHSVPLYYSSLEMLVTSSKCSGSSPLHCGGEVQERRCSWQGAWKPNGSIAPEIRTHFRHSLDACLASLSIVMRQLGWRRDSLNICSLTNLDSWNEVDHFVVWWRTPTRRWLMRLILFKTFAWVQVFRCVPTTRKLDNAKTLCFSKSGTKKLTQSGLSQLLLLSIHRRRRGEDIIVLSCCSLAELVTLNLCRFDDYDDSHIGTPSQ